MSSDLTNEEKRELVSIIGKDVESTAALIIGGFDVNELTVGKVMNVENQHYHVALQVQPIPEEKAEEIKEGLRQAGQQQGDDTE